MELKIPELSLIVLMGASSAGKSSFARHHFKATQIVSSDGCRGLVSDDENSQEASGDAFDLLHYLVEKRLKRGLLTVVDATNLQAESRKRLLDISRKYHFASVVVALDIAEKVLLERHRKRTDREFSDRVIQNHHRDFRNSLRGLDREFKYAFVLRDRDIEKAVFNIQPTWNNKKTITGPFDIIGDVHGCYDELLELLAKLGYTIVDELKIMPTVGEVSNLADGLGANLADGLDAENFKNYTIINPEGRTAVFVGDLVDRGPNSPDVLRLVMQMCDEGKAWCVVGNHDDKLKRYLDGKDVKINYGLEMTVEQLKGETADFKKKADRKSVV